MVDLRHDRDAAAVEPLDDQHITGADRVRVGCLRTLRPRPRAAIAPRAGEDPAAEMTLQVELGVVHPHRMTESPRDGNDAAAERREPAELVREDPGQGVEGEPALEGGDVGDDDLDRVHMGRRGLRERNFGSSPVIVSMRQPPNSGQRLVET